MERRAKLYADFQGVYAGTDRPTFVLVVAGREFPTARERFVSRVAKQETR